jgi:hypothetical protein
MSINQEAINNNPLFREFAKLGDFENVSRAEIDILKAMVLKVAAQIEPHLKFIQNTFQQYTDHDIQHLLNIATHIYSFLPKLSDSFARRRHVR